MDTNNFINVEENIQNGTNDRQLINGLCSKVTKYEQEINRMKQMIMYQYTENDKLKRENSFLKSNQENYHDIADSLRAHRMNYHTVYNQMEQMKISLEQMNQTIIALKSQTFVCYHCNQQVSKLDCDSHLAECEECPICKVRDPVEKKLIIKGCGHKICPSCLPRLETGQYVICPMCRKKSKKIYLKDF